MGARPAIQSTRWSRLREQRGFTLIELLVVILIVGILAAIALPAFLDQRKKGQDSAAKSDARNMLGHMQACFVETKDYTRCNEPSELGQTGLEWGSAAGQVSVVQTAETTESTFALNAWSKSGNRFKVVGSSTGQSSRQCITTRPLPDGGCKGTGTGGWGSW